jgi:hypothetical protein
MSIDVVEKSLRSGEGNRSVIKLGDRFTEAREVWPRHLRS